MKLIYTHEFLPMVANAQNLLLQAGIECRIENTYAGGGFGELSAFDTWPELWLEDERQLPRAKAVLEPLLQSTPLAEWQCLNCGEQNAVSFDFCWHCEAAKPHHPVSD